MVRRWVPLVLACCVAGSARPAAAQFTSAVIPVRAPVPETAAVAAHADTTRRARGSPDTSAAATLASMKLWVDSAAEALGTQAPATAADTTSGGTVAAPARPTKRPTRPRRDTATTRAGVASGKVTRFRNGAPAPDTATPLPLLALLGLGAVATGALLRRR